MPGFSPQGVVQGLVNSGSGSGSPAAAVDLAQGRVNPLSVCLRWVPSIAGNRLTAAAETVSGNMVRIKQTARRLTDDLAAHGHLATDEPWLSSTAPKPVEMVKRVPCPVLPWLHDFC